MNIAPAAEIDPWPRYGLVAKYKPFILNRIRPLLENNRHLARREVITDAIRITWECSQKFKPELGFDFSTYLRHLLPNRLYDLYGIEKSKTDVEPDVLKTDPVRFLGGGNGARLVLDTGVMVVGAGMVGNDLDYLTGTLDRIRESSAAVPRDHENAKDYLRAIVDHAERREREAQAEAEQGGVVILEARDLRADVRLFKENHLVRFKPITLLRERDAVPHGYQIDGVALPLKGEWKKPPIVRKPRVPEGNFDQEAWELDQFAKLGELTERELRAVSLMRVGVIDTKIAEGIGVSQGHFSKLKPRILEKLRKGRKKLYSTEPDDREAWADINCLIEGNDDDGSVRD